MSKATPRDKKKPPPFIHYSALAFQMIALILILTYTGYRVDLYFNLSIPVFMIIFILLGLFGFLYKLIKSAQ